MKKGTEAGIQNEESRSGSPQNPRAHHGGALRHQPEDGEFERADLESLNTIAGTVALSIENARVSEELEGPTRK